MSKNNPFLNKSKRTKKKQVFPLSGDQGRKPSFQPSKQEKDSSIEEAAKPRSPLSSFKGRKRANPHKLIFAIVSALTIGLISGFTILYLLTDREAAPDQGQQEAISQPTRPISQGVEEEGMMTLDIPSLEAFTLQLGMFSEKENAQLFIDSISDAGLYPTLWEGRGEYFVFVGLDKDRGGMEALQQDLENQELEAFIKSWQRASTSLQLAEAEGEWLTDFLALMETTFSDRESFPQEAWIELLDTTPEDSEAILPLIKEIEGIVTSPLEDPLEIAHFLFMARSGLEKIEKSPS